LIGPSQKSFETLETPQYKNIHSTQKHRWAIFAQLYMFHGKNLGENIWGPK
jgi:hypothetical protein